MTDQELLTFAAKAIGRCMHPNTRRSLGNWGCDTVCIDCHKHIVEDLWSPLTNDGDALKLAVALNMTVQCSYATVWIETATPQLEIARTHLNKNPGEAVRRAIVEAAAEVGKRMP